MASLTQCLKPSAALLCKLGSIAVHVEEMFSATGHEFDKVATEQLIRDAEVQEWLRAMDNLAMLPKKRTIEDVKLAAKRAKIKRSR